MLVVDIPYAVLEDFGVAVSVFVIFRNDIFLGLLPSFGSILLRLEEVCELSCLVYFLEGTLSEEASF